MPLVSQCDGILYLGHTTGRRYIDACSGAITCNVGVTTTPRKTRHGLSNLIGRFQLPHPVSKARSALDLANRPVGPD